MASPTQWIGILSKLQEIVEDRGAWHATVQRITESDTTERLNNSVGQWNRVESLTVNPRVNG